MAGEGHDAPLLMLPGTLCDARVFAPLLAHLAPRESHVADLTGTADRRALAQRILATAPPRFALLGFSLGAIVALEIATLAPERVLGIALVAANLDAVPPQDHAPRTAATRLAEAIGVERFVADTLWPTYAAPGADPALRDTVVAMARSQGCATFAAQTALALARPDLRPRLATLACPALVLGGVEDRVAPPQRQRDIAARLPDATLALIPDAGHLVLLERPGPAAAHVADWLERVDTAIPAATTSIEEHV